MDSPQVVCVQGLGFVGAAMAAAVASARDGAGLPLFHVVGVDLPNDSGLARIQALNDGRFPFPSTDEKLNQAVADAHRSGNLQATSDTDVYSRARVVLVDIHLDVGFADGAPRLELDGLRRAIQTLGERIAPGTLVIVETTVPPGTCLKFISPILDACAVARGLEPGAFLLAHSYERVMPGDGYFDSITNFWRVYAGHTPEAADACEAFLSKVINVKKFPLTRLHSTTASETAKVLENSYRATTIAFMEEWGRFAEAVGVDIFDVVKAIRIRPTHSNIRQPGFGVGGYCLTKDPLFAPLAAREFFGREVPFPFSTMAVQTNRAMPTVSVDRLRQLLGGTLEGKHIVLAGVSYRPGVGDTRFAPAETFVRCAREAGAQVTCHDPLVTYWPELDMVVPQTLPDAGTVDALVFGVGHKEYQTIDFAGWLGGRAIAILDSDNVLPSAARARLRASGCQVESIGRGDGL